MIAASLMALGGRVSGTSHERHARGDEPARCKLFNSLRPWAQPIVRAATSPPYAAFGSPRRRRGRKVRQLLMQTIEALQPTRTIQSSGRMGDILAAPRGRPTDPEPNGGLAARAGQHC